MRDYAVKELPQGGHVVVLEAALDRDCVDVGTIVYACEGYEEALDAVTIMSLSGDLLPLLARLAGKLVE